MTVPDGLPDRIDWSHRMALRHLFGREQEWFGVAGARLVDPSEDGSYSDLARLLDKAAHIDYWLAVPQYAPAPVAWRCQQPQGAPFPCSSARTIARYGNPSELASWVDGVHDGSLGTALHVQAYVDASEQFVVGAAIRIPDFVLGHELGLARSNYARKDGASFRFLYWRQVAESGRWIRIVGDFDAAVPPRGMPATLPRPDAAVWRTGSLIRSDLAALPWMRETRRWP